MKFLIKTIIGCFAFWGVADFADRHPNAFAYAMLILLGVGLLYVAFDVVKSRLSQTPENPRRRDFPSNPNRIPKTYEKPLRTPVDPIYPHNP